MISSRREYLLKHLRGKNHRLAFRAIAELRRLGDGSLASIVSGYKAKDEQRQFQFFVAQIVIEKGVAGLAEQWSALPSPGWRESLITEIGQFLDLWMEESLVDVLIAALNDPDETVHGRAVIQLRGLFMERSPIEKWVTRQRRAQITEALVIEGCQ